MGKTQGRGDKSKGVGRGSRRRVQVDVNVLVSEAVRPTSAVHVVMVLDRSGSMATQRTGTIQGINEYWNGLRADKGHPFYVSLTQFDSDSWGNTMIDHVYLAQPLAHVRPLTLDGYVPRGGTPLFDAVAQTIQRVEQRASDLPADVRTILVVVTDGQENSSKIVKSRDHIREVLTRKERDGWTVIYMGADMNAWDGATRDLGLQHIGNTFSYQSSAPTVAYAGLLRSTQAYAMNNVAGTSETAFFSGTGGQLDPAAVATSTTGRYVEDDAAAAGSDSIMPPKGSRSAA